MSIQETIEIRVSNKLIILRLFKRHGKFPCLLVNKIYLAMLGNGARLEEIQNSVNYVCS